MDGSPSSGKLFWIGQKFWKVRDQYFFGFWFIPYYKLSVIRYNQLIVLQYYLKWNGFACCTEIELAPSSEGVVGPDFTRFRAGSDTFSALSHFGRPRTTK